MFIVLGSGQEHASAQVPQLISYQGRIVVGATNFDGTGQFKFGLMNAAGATAYCVAMLQPCWTVIWTNSAKQRTHLAPRPGNKNPYCVGAMYAAIGEREKALAWLEKSYAMRQADLVSMKIDPPLDSVRDDEHYKDLLRRIHLTE